MKSTLLIAVLSLFSITYQSNIEGEVHELIEVTIVGWEVDYEESTPIVIIKGENKISIRLEEEE